ncbi:hypothetical protein D9757_008737 [Collybiopsis confluens]|uniref:Transmembrane protein n=1 Tax=Collybiopsis confluens TaxID=2823264 RepID=A0A8H5H921_9AGAR|nr:hypothetical protein D9757_008737 [Collybiopsis confluens]
MFALILLSLIQATFSLPTSRATDGSGVTFQTNSNSQTRSTSDIVWSCLTTIFACTWVAVHPNVPSIEDSDFQLLWRRMKIVAVALVAPEFIIIWAASQLRSAMYALKRLREIDACKHWTMTHGMFLVMGGFMLTDASGKRIQTLQEDDLAHLLRKGDIKLPPLTGAEIMDKSKGDALAKLVVLIQTSWFIAQVFSRVVLRLAITELELTTLAFALLNFLTYGLWWKKPLDVRYPILLSLQHDTSDALFIDEALPASRFIRSSGFGAENSDRISPGSVRDDRLDEEWRRHTRKHDLPPDTGPPLANGEVRNTPSEVPAPTSNHQPGSDETDPEKRDSVKDESEPSPDSQTGGHGRNPSEKSEGDAEVIRSGDFFNVLTSVNLSAVPRSQQSTSLTSPLRTARYLLLRTAHSLALSLLKLGQMFLFPAREWTGEKQKYSDSVPMFYAGSQASFLDPYTHPLLHYLSSMILEMLIGTLFGSIHCAAWAFQFPSILERDLWRTMSLCITVAPLVMITVVIAAWKTRYAYLAKVNRFVLPIYILARLTILIMAFVLLRDLSDGAFEVVQWTAFIPHV